MRQLVLNTTQSILGRFGMRLVRWPRQLRSHDAPADPTQFFPIGDPRPWTVPDDLRQNPAPWARTLVDLYDDEGSWPSSIVPEGGMLLQALIRNITPRVIVETGTCLGMSTIWMAGALRAAGGTKLHTFDLFKTPPEPRLAASPLFQNRLEGVRSRLARAGVDDLVEIHVGDSAEQLRASHALLREQGGVQFAFLDADHSPKGVLADLHALEPVLQIGGVVVLHDVFPQVCNHVGPRWMVDHLSEVSTAKYQFCDLYTAQTNYGVTVMRRIA